MSEVVIDYTHMLREGGLPSGVEAASLRGELQRAFETALVALRDRMDTGELGFLDLSADPRTVVPVEALSEKMKGKFDDLVVLGIGGSALGVQVLRDALLLPFWNELAPAERRGFPRLHVCDNPDPHTLSALLCRLNPERTLFNVISKSGSTAETIAQYLVVRGWLSEAMNEDQVAGHFVFTTDPERGGLREVGESEGIPLLSIPSNVGGRFSVLSPVGLFPASMTGIAVSGLLAGAETMKKRCLGSDLAENPAAVLATLLYDRDRRGQRIHVLMPYLDRLHSFSLWFQQLWGESLGKSQRVGDDEVEVGPTPVASRGATDQHSLLQLMMDGPADKVVLFVQLERDVDLVIPADHSSIESFRYLAGRTLGELLETELEATAEALRQRDRPNLTIRIGELNPTALGSLFALFEIATILAAGLYGVNPLDQPGVELSKQLTYAAFGREGYQESRIARSDQRWIV